MGGHGRHQSGVETCSRSGRAVQRHGRVVGRWGLTGEDCVCTRWKTVHKVGARSRSIHPWPGCRTDAGAGTPAGIFAITVQERSQTNATDNVVIHTTQWRTQTSRSQSNLCIFAIGATALGCFFDGLLQGTKLNICAGNYLLMMSFLILSLWVAK